MEKLQKDSNKNKDKEKEENNKEKEENIEIKPVAPVSITKKMLTDMTVLSVSLQSKIKNYNNICRRTKERYIKKEIMMGIEALKKETADMGLIFKRLNSEYHDKILQHIEGLRYEATKDLSKMKDTNTYSLFFGIGFGIVSYSFFRNEFATMIGFFLGFISYYLYTIFGGRGKTKERDEFLSELQEWYIKESKTMQGIVLSASKNEMIDEKFIDNLKNDSLSKVFKKFGKYDSLP